MLGVVDLKAPWIRRRVIAREVIRHSPAFIWAVAPLAAGRWLTCAGMSNGSQM